MKAFTKVIFASALFASALHAETYYWNSTNVTFGTAANWLVPDGSGGYKTATSAPTATASTNIKRAETQTTEIQINATSILKDANNNAPFASWINDTTATTLWQFYFNNIILNIDTITQSATSELRMRRSNSSTTFDINSSNVNVSAGKLSLGNAASANMFAGTVSVTSALNVSGGELAINANVFNASSAVTTLSGGTINIFQSSGGTTPQGLVATPTTANLGTLNFSGAGTINFGASSTYKIKSANISTLNATSTSGSNSTLNFNTTDTATIDNINFETVNFKITSSNGVNVTNNFTVSGANATLKNLDIASAALAVKKLFVVNSAISIGTGTTSILNAYLSVGGISGGNANSGNRITTKYTDAASGNAYITITGVDGTVGATTVFSGRVHDMAQLHTISSLGNYAKLNITMNASDPTAVQYLGGDNYYRGTTTITSGTLYLRADKTNNVNWGVANIVLQGGAFGACGKAYANGSVDAIGTVYATDLTWSAGNLLFDINGASADKLIFSGSLATGTEDTYTIKLNLINFDPETQSTYEIIGWESLVSAEDFDESKLVADLGGAEDTYTASFAKTASGLTVTISAIPEPAQFAALFGLAALLIAIRRRRA